MQGLFWIWFCMPSTQVLYVTVCLVLAEYKTAVLWNRMSERGHYTSTETTYEEICDTNLQLARFLACLFGRIQPAFSLIQPMTDWWRITADGLMRALNCTLDLALNHLGKQYHNYSSQDVYMTGHLTPFPHAWVCFDCQGASSWEPGCMLQASRLSKVKIWLCSGVMQLMRCFWLAWPQSCCSDIWSVNCVNLTDLSTRHRWLIEMLLRSIQKHERSNWNITLPKGKRHPSVAITSCYRVCKIMIVFDTCRHLPGILFLELQAWNVWHQ